MSKRKSRRKHWKKEEAEKNENTILGLLNYKDMRFKDLQQEFEGISPTTLSGHLKTLLRKKTIARYWNEDKKANYYQITPESKDQVIDKLGKYEAIRFVKGISNPAYACKPSKDGTKAVAVFSTVPETMNRGKYKDIIKKTVSVMFPAFKIPKAVTKQKIAIVVMYDPEGIKGSG